VLRVNLLFGKGFEMSTSDHNEVELTGASGNCTFKWDYTQQKWKPNTDNCTSGTKAHEPNSPGSFPNEIRAGTCRSGKTT